LVLHHKEEQQMGIARFEDRSTSTFRFGGRHRTVRCRSPEWIEYLGCAKRATSTDKRNIVKQQLLIGALFIHALSFRLMFVVGGGGRCVGGARSRRRHSDNRCITAKQRQQLARSSTKQAKRFVTIS
jgi:hypothetical protein